MNSANKTNDYDFNSENIKDSDDSTVIRMSRGSIGYTYTNDEGGELGISVARTMNLLDSQIKPADEVFYDLCINEHDLAEKIGVSYSNLHTDITKGTFLETLRTSAFIYKIINDKGEIERYKSLNAMSSVDYDEKTGTLMLRKNLDMKEFLLQLGKDNPYFEIFTDLANKLAKHKQIELYKVIENELSIFQYRLGMANKQKMMMDHKWHELHIPIFRIRQSTFTLNTYPDTFKFVSTLLKRQLETISKNTDIEIDYKNAKANKRGKDAEYVIMSVRRKEGYINLLKEQSEQPSEQEHDLIFQDEELNNLFWEYIALINPTNDRRIESYKKKLIKLTETEDKSAINIELAKEIIEQSIRREWNDFYPIVINDKVKNNSLDMDEEEMKRLYLEKHKNVHLAEYNSMKQLGTFDGTFEEFRKKKWEDYIKDIKMKNI